jgi:hypothetical protein
MDIAQLLDPGELHDGRGMSFIAPEAFLTAHCSLLAVLGARTSARLPSQPCSRWSRSSAMEISGKSNSRASLPMVSLGESDHGNQCAFPAGLTALVLRNC